MQRCAKHRAVKSGWSRGNVHLASLKRMTPTTPRASTRYHDADIRLVTTLPTEPKSVTLDIFANSAGYRYARSS
jgi:hypothetical protein